MRLPVQPASACRLRKGCFFSHPQPTVEYESVVAPEGIPLQAQIEELRPRAQAVARLQGGHSHYLEEVRIFREYIEEHHLLWPSDASLNLPPDQEGNRHQVCGWPENRKRALP